MMHCEQLYSHDLVAGEEKPKEIPYIGLKDKHTIKNVAYFSCCTFGQHIHQVKTGTTLKSL